MAGPEAYPLTVAVRPGYVTRPPLTWELELLEGCLRSIPAFIRQKEPATSVAVPAASGELRLRLSWAELG